MAAEPILRTVTILADGMLIGVPVWVFFIQSPLLFKFMGRDRFISPMMRLTSTMFRWTLPVCASVSLGLSFTLSFSKSTTPIIGSSVVCFSALLINSIIIVPRALAAGKQATRTVDRTQKVTDFAVDGGHKSDTRTLHQTVVLFVTIHLVAAICHVHFVVNSK
mmetsp:Transcript_18073/g.23327  ORF Transcript_18073/g.23327 Transcript_18073/m.23327 type:complete len:163 (-) Transcript_18073:315-803(-)